MNNDVRFGATVGGHTAEALAAEARVLGVRPEELLHQVLAEALAERFGRTGAPVVVHLHRVNQGANGEHVLTVTQDPRTCTLTAEDANGDVTAQVASTGDEPAAHLLTTLVTRWVGTPSLDDWLS